ncbi:MAG TPA: hypothetical protein VMM93_00370 [Vicinamibacterales bacterium]|nr:hypothetical protein [Vicinamibacterales bacterium]
MSSERPRAKRRRLALALAAGLGATVVAAADQAPGPRFYPDDPIPVDHDRTQDASGVRPQDLSETYDFLEHTFVARGDRARIRAVNVNTVDEVPDSSWFTNRIGRRPMSVAEIVRGPDRVDRLEAPEWVIVAGKGPAGFQPGFRAVDPRRPDELFQFEVDLEDHADLASGAELIGTTFYHAIGYHVVDTYLVNVHPSQLRIGETATIRDASGRRRFAQGDLDEVIRLAAKNPDGSIRMSAGRFVEGRPIGNFRYHGTRPDDPNDIHPHEHRRELRGNRVFCAWLNHDDSRALNTLEMLVTADGRQFVRHYMFDFGSILGSSPERWWSGHAYLYEPDSTLRGLRTLGIWIPPWRTMIDPRRQSPAVGRFDAASFDPPAWRPEYPNPAFDNMRADDAFWAARIVNRFTDDAIRAVVAKAAYREAEAARVIADALITRRDRIARTWLTGVNPIVDPQLSADGRWSFANAAVDAGVATPAAEYRLTWSRFDNATGVPVGPTEETRAATLDGRAPTSILNGSEFVALTVRSIHPDHPVWQAPVHIHFRRTASGWDTVGLEREVVEGDGAQKRNPIAP